MPEAEVTVLLDRCDAIAVITLNRPERRNGVTVEMCQVVHEVVQEVAASDARVVVLRGSGDHFCVGADITAVSEGERQPSPGPDELGLIHHAATILHTMPQVTIAAIDGGCAGAGMGWAAACDLRFATPRARFSTAFLNVGVSGDMGLAWSLDRIVGGARAREMLLFPDRFGADEALGWGLVTRLFEPADLFDQTMNLAGDLCKRDPYALRMMKANCLSAEHLTMQEFVEIETARHLHSTNRPDMGARMASAFNKGRQQ